MNDARQRRVDTLRMTLDAYLAGKTTAAALIETLVQEVVAINDELDANGNKVD